MYVEGRFGGSTGWGSGAKASRPRGAPELFYEERGCAARRRARLAATRSGARGVRNALPVGSLLNGRVPMMAHSPAAHASRVFSTPSRTSSPCALRRFTRAISHSMTSWTTSPRAFSRSCRASGTAAGLPRFCAGVLLGLVELAPGHRLAIAGQADQLLLGVDRPAPPGGSPRSPAACGRRASPGVACTPSRPPWRTSRAAAAGRTPGSGCSARRSGQQAAQAEHHLADHGQGARLQVAQGGSAGGSIRGGISGRRRRPRPRRWPGPRRGRPRWS